MPGKMIYYQQLAEAMTRQIAGDAQEWARFLTTAARLYKYPYHEQLLIYAQRPDATACAGYDLWNNTMHRYVRLAVRELRCSVLRRMGCSFGMCSMWQTPGADAMRGSRSFGRWMQKILLR